MVVTPLHKFLTAPVVEKHRDSTSRIAVAFWLGLSLCFAAAYITMALRRAFDGEYVVGDNAREYLSWMHRYSNPELFPHDLIADYFQSVTPIGYGALYKLMAGLGIDPVLLSKLLPMALGLVTTSYGFAVCMQILPVPLAGFIATLLLNQSLCMHDDLVSGCPRDFFYPLFLAFLYYLLRRSLWPCLVVIALQCLFYPLIPFISSGILLLRLWDWQGRHFSQNRWDYLFCATGLGVALLTIMPYAIKSSEFGPTITATMARTMPEYLSGGRVSYFYLNPVNFWLDGRDSGALALMSPPQLLIGLVLPIFILLPSRFPLTKHLKNGISILPQIVLASLGMFFAAHALAFKLHWPSRYTHHSFKMVFAISTGLVIAIVLDAAFDWANRHKPGLQGRQILALGTTTLVLTGLILYPSSLKFFPRTPYVSGGVPELYKFLQQQPQDSLIASLAGETDNVPVFAKRSILVGKEYALPFHTRYYTQFHQRAIDLIEAQYSPNINQVKHFIHKYGITFWVLERSAFKPEYIADNSWIRQYQPAAEAIAKLKQGTVPVVSRFMKPCAAFEAESLVVLKAECIENASQEQ